MHKVISILGILTDHLPEIKQALGERWPIFADQMRAQATSFEKITNEGDLAEATNQLLGLFMMDETTREILTRPRTTGTRHPQPKVESEISLETIANRFYELCSQPDKVAKLDDPDKSMGRSDSTSKPKTLPPKRRTNYD